MLGAENVWTWPIANLQTLLPEDWTAPAGELFREGTQAISQVDVTNGRVLDDLEKVEAELGVRKLEGVVTKEHSEAEKLRRSRQGLHGNRGQEY